LQHWAIRPVISAACYQLEADDDLRCCVLFARGEHFTARLDLATVGRTAYVPEGQDPVHLRR
jgi:enoyl-CoA hydratase/carnithine racemase